MSNFYQSTMSGKISFWIKINNFCIIKSNFLVQNIFYRSINQKDLQIMRNNEIYLFLSPKEKDSKRLNKGEKEFRVGGENSQSAQIINSAQKKIINIKREKGDRSPPTPVVSKNQSTTRPTTNRSRSKEDVYRNNFKTKPNETDNKTKLNGKSSKLDVNEYAELDIDLANDNDEENEQAIIERRRREREKLLQVNIDKECLSNQNFDIF